MVWTLAYRKWSPADITSSTGSAFCDQFGRNPERGGRQQPHQTLKKSKKYKGGKKHHTMVTHSTPKMPKWHHSALKA